ncbi:hypothetical protein BCR35DRAFT_355508 [Leucosporidium creatinivorum]|uniref:DUF6534 domain-containing protein n=1 Tax=Leucosporidium creatinivorum TaxID=106004 RepID=A0A1Y2DFF3_9BASI|nr:hypothetical protein BCR35DRAFT_355508 [Leucosporidium creatinivorum]
MAFVQADVNSSLGALLAGTWLNSGLYAIELLQVWKYFSRKPEGVIVKAVVVLLLLIDTVAQISDYACVWLYTVTHWGDEEFAAKQYAPIPIYLITTGLIGFICQSFLIVRLGRLSKSWWLPGLLVAPAGVGLSGALTAAAKVIMYPDYHDRNQLNVAVTIWLVSAAATDVLIALSLLWYLNRVRVSAKKFDQSRLTGALGRICLMTMETGTVTSVLAVVIFVVYITNPEGNIATGLCFALARIYSLNILITLNQAHSLSKSTHGNSSSSNGGKTGAFAGIEIIHTATVRIDDPREREEGRAIDLQELGGRRGGGGVGTFAIGRDVGERSEEDKVYMQRGDSL